MAEPSTASGDPPGEVARRRLDEDLIQGQPGLDSLHAARLNPLQVWSCGLRPRWPDPIHECWKWVPISVMGGHRSRIPLRTPSLRSHRQPLITSCRCACGTLDGRQVTTGSDERTSGTKRGSRICTLHPLKRHRQVTVAMLELAHDIQMTEVRVPGPGPRSSGYE
jgi:hypothetical protein